MFAAGAVHPFRRIAVEAEQVEERAKTVVTLVRKVVGNSRIKAFNGPKPS